MTEDVANGTSAFGMWAGCFGSDDDASLRIDYSCDQGKTWVALGNQIVTKGSLQHIVIAADIQGQVRFRIQQTTGSRVNIDDITIYGRKSFKKGDVNGDGEVNIADVNVLINIILNDGQGVDEQTMQRADVNEDNEVTLADINSLIDIILES